MTRVRNFLNRHVRVSRPAAATTALMVGAALLVFLVLVAVQQNLWVWVERASWVIALVLFPAAIYQLVVLQRDQRRLADQLTKKPDVRVGLRVQPPGGLPGVNRNLKVAVRWEPNATMSEVVRLPVAAVNVGTLTAHNVLINLVFPKQVEIILEPPATDIREESGTRQLIYREHPSLHIGVTIDLAVSIRIGAELGNGFAILAHISTENTPYITAPLLVTYYQ